MDIPVLLLRTRSQGHDAYEEYLSEFDGFSASAARASPPNERQSDPGDTSSVRFLPESIPVLDHGPNLENVARLEGLLGSGRLREEYGGMIFTSQRAVEVWAEVVRKVEMGEVNVEGWGESGRGVKQSSNTAITENNANPPLLDSDHPFPLYVVGPATSRALSTLVDESHARARTNTPSCFSALNPTIQGAHTGNGQTLAPFILHHYNTLHSQYLYTHWEAPRLPFTPLIGPHYGYRCAKDDARLRKKPLLFMVGEQRRDIIPKTLMDQDLPEVERVDVEEWEVYRTTVKDGFEEEFGRRVQEVKRAGSRVVVVVVVFSPQGCGDMLRCLGFVDSEGSITEKGRTRWSSSGVPGSLETSTFASSTDPNSTSDAASLPRQSPETETKFVIATIGPTTYTHLRRTFGFEADVCAEKPSPEGAAMGVWQFLRENGLVLSP